MFAPLPKGAVLLAGQLHGVLSVMADVWAVCSASAVTSSSACLAISTPA